jgi:drug/metabolite transporter (DMT)-like permease
MQVAFLYATAVLIWGSTWIAITVSVAYRFGLGSMSLFAYAAISGRRVRIPFESYGYVILMGVLMYSGSYMMLYHATSYVTSGLVAVIFSLIVAVNAFFERIFFRKPLERRMMLASRKENDAGIRHRCGRNRNPFLARSFFV